MTLSRAKDLAPQRWDRIRDIAQKEGFIRVDNLCQELTVSPATIRRDLEELERRGHLRRVHGGAVNMETSLEENVFDVKTGIATKEKKAIAQAAFKLIKPEEAIYLDGGSTVLELARLLRHRSDITVITNSIHATNELASQGPRLILIGGELRRLSQTTVGPLTEPSLGELNFDKAFMGTMGLTFEAGMTTTEPGEALTKRLVVQKSREVILLADASKAGKTFFAHAGVCQDIDVLITSKGFPEDMANELSALNTKVIET